MPNPLPNRTGGKHGRVKNGEEWQRGPPTGLGITTLTPTPRAVIPGTEIQAGARKSGLGKGGDRRLRTGRGQGKVPQSDRTRNGVPVSKFSVSCPN